MKRQLPLGSFVVTFVASAPAFAQTSVSVPLPGSSSASAVDPNATPRGAPTWMVAGLVLGLIVGYLIGVQAGRRKAALAPS